MTGQKKNKNLLFFFVFCSTFTIFANKLAKMLMHLCRLEPNLNANTKYGKENKDSQREIVGRPYMGIGQ